MSLVFRILLAIFAFMPAGCFASEIFHLTNGFEIAAKSHSIEGDRFVLVTGSGSLQLPQSQIDSIEAMPDPPLPVPALVASLPPAHIETPIELLQRAALSQGNAPEFVRLVRSIAIAESGLHQEAISPKGAIGIMQLMPATAKLLGVEASNVEQNARGGAQLLAELLEKYKFDAIRAIAAYNAGTVAVGRYGGLPPYPETQAYVRRVLHIYQQLSKSETTTVASSAH